MDAYIEPTNNRKVKFFRKVKQKGSGVDLDTLRDGMRLGIDAERAREILAQYAFDGQRAMDVSNRRAHALDMQGGRFQAGSQIVFARLPNGHLIMVDGYHRLNAVIDADANIEFQIRINPVDDIDGVRDLYCSIDTNLRKRTDAQIVRAAGLTDELGIAQNIMTAALGAVTTIACGLRVLPMHQRPADVLTAYGRKDAVAAWAAEIRIYEDVIAGATVRMKMRLITNGMMAPALVTLRHQSAMAIEFWKGVADNDGLHRGDPRKTLIDTILESSHRGRTEAGLIYASRAWNAWFLGRDLKFLRVHETSRCQLLGTPFAPPDKGKRDDE